MKCETVNSATPLTSANVSHINDEWSIANEMDWFLHVIRGWMRSFTATSRPDSEWLTSRGIVCGRPITTSRAQHYIIVTYKGLIGIVAVINWAAVTPLCYASFRADGIPLTSSYRFRGAVFLAINPIESFDVKPQILCQRPLSCRTRGTPTHQ